MTPLLTLETAATESIVTLDEMKQQLRITDDIENDYIEALIDSATSFLEGPEGATGRVFVTQTWSLSVSAPKNNAIRIPLAPVQSISSIEYYDSDDALQSATVGDFYLYATNDWAMIEPKSGTSWPVTRQRKDAIKVTFIAGYGAASAVPDLAKHIVKLLVSDWFENRGAVINSQNRSATLSDLPPGLQSLINHYRLDWVA